MGDKGMRGDIRMEDLAPDFRWVAEVIGLEAALRLVAIRGGDTLYVPMLHTISRKARNRGIAEEFNGVNHREVARAHDLTVSAVRLIVRAAGDKQYAQDGCQPCLPGFG